MKPPLSRSAVTVCVLVPVVLVVASCSSDAAQGVPSLATPGAATAATSATNTIAAVAPPTALGPTTAPTTAPPTVVPPTTVAPPTVPPTTVAPTTVPPTTTIVTSGALVLVANASSVPGSAGRLSKKLARIGFTMLPATDAAGFEDLLDASKVYFLPGAEAVAASLALLMGGISVSPMPTPAPIFGATLGLGDATVLVMLGKDLADRRLPGASG